jgi:hypothetical protein
MTAGRMTCGMYIHQTSRRGAGVRLSVLTTRIDGVEIDKSERQRTFVRGTR